MWPKRPPDRKEMTVVTSPPPAAPETDPQDLTDGVLIEFKPFPDDALPQCLAFLQLAGQIAAVSPDAPIVRPVLDFEDEDDDYDDEFDDDEEDDEFDDDLDDEDELDDDEDELDDDEDELDDEDDE